MPPPARVAAPAAGRSRWLQLRFTGAAMPAGWRRATPAQLQRVPPGLRTTLPLRLARFAGKSVAAAALPPPTYADLQAWLGAERALRADFPRRFGALAADPVFRKGLVSASN